MIQRTFGYLELRDGDVPDASRRIEEQGFAQLRGVLTPAEIEALSAEIEAIYAGIAPDMRAKARPEAHNEHFRYEMLNRGALCQKAVGHPRILEVIEPLLGDDCHVIANTAWRNPPDPDARKGGPWHIDAGPHVPRPEGIPWDDRIPYPIFAIGVHVYLRDCPIECGPTGVIPGSHKSGRTPPFDRLFDDDLDCGGERVRALDARAGDVALFASDVWHRRMPTRAGDRGRFFLQVHYGRRDIAQRLRTSDQIRQLSDDAVARASDARSRTLVGLHEPFFYDG